MPAVSALLRELPPPPPLLPYQPLLFASVAILTDGLDSHIKGKASHKIISDGTNYPLLLLPEGQKRLLSRAQRKICYAT